MRGAFYYLGILGNVYLVELPPPPPQIEYLEDGSVQITVGDQIGWVSSAHLIETKVFQLGEVWKAEHSSL